MRKVVSAIGCALLASCATPNVCSPIPPAPSKFGGASVFGMPSPLKPIYNFQNGKDGAYPYSGLAKLGGVWYGTTYGGGTPDGWGTIYCVDAQAKEHVLHRFKANDDGAHPYAGLTAMGGALYGTTQQGGRRGSGTIFRVTPTGDEQVIYSFRGGWDGQYPYGNLVAVDGALYGTTYQGGIAPGWGVVFKVDPSGSEEVLYRFKANADAAHPYAGLTLLNDVLYGTTIQGGTHGSGTVFRIAAAGHARIIYSFKGGRDGASPYAPLLAYNGALYGTTYQGGVYPGWGVVFKVSPNGAEHVLYRFRANDDGAHPQLGGLIAYRGELYGTTYQGGTSGFGTIYAINPAGKEQILYSFTGNADGGYPYDGLTAAADGLYGTANVAGVDGYGTVFALKP